MVRSAGGSFFGSGGSAQSKKSSTSKKKTDVKNNNSNNTFYSSFSIDEYYINGSAVCNGKKCDCTVTGPYQYANKTASSTHNSLDDCKKSCSSFCTSQIKQQIVTNSLPQINMPANFSTTKISGYDYKSNMVQNSISVQDKTRVAQPVVKKRGYKCLNTSGFPPGNTTGQYCWCEKTKPVAGVWSFDFKEKKVSASDCQLTCAATCNG